MAQERAIDMAANETGNVLAQLSDALAEAVERAGASTVRVSARRRIGASGVVWDTGVVLTADHVVERDEAVAVGLPDGREVQAKVAGRDPGSDLAVLRADTGAAPIAERAPAEAKVGHMVLAVGRPVDGPPMASVGVISAVGGPWRTFRGGQVEGYIRSDTTFFPGFSGGPLVDAAGRVVGLNSSRLARGAGLTVPSAAAGRIAEALLKQGRLRRGYLGVGSQAARLPTALASKLGREQQAGLLVVTVEPGTPAERAGVMIGDLLVDLGGTPVQDHEDLQALLGPESVGRPLPATVLRGGEPLALTIDVGERA